MTMTERSRKLGLSGAALTLALLLAGCTAQGNARLAQGGPSGGKTRAAEPVTIPALSAAERAESEWVDRGAKLTGLSRADWPRTDIHIPVDGLYAFPSYAREHHLTKETARQRGSPVNIMSAMEGSGDTVHQQAREALYSPALAVWDLVRSPYDWYADAPPWQERWYPTDRPYHRSAAGVPVVVRNAPPAPTPAGGQ
jgi:hypothetical protein